MSCSFIKSFFSIWSSFEVVLWEVGNPLLVGKITELGSSGSSDGGFLGSLGSSLGLDFLDLVLEALKDGPLSLFILIGSLFFLSLLLSKSSLLLNLSGSVDSSNLGLEGGFFLFSGWLCSGLGKSSRLGLESLFVSSLLGGFFLFSLLLSNGGFLNSLVLLFSNDNGGEFLLILGAQVLGGLSNSLSFSLSLLCDDWSSNLLGLEDSIGSSNLGLSVLGVGSLGFLKRWSGLLSWSFDNSNLALRSNLWGSLWSSLGGSLWSSLGSSGWGSLWSSLGSSSWSISKVEWLIFSLSKREVLLPGTGSWFDVKSDSLDLVEAHGSHESSQDERLSEFH